VNVVSLDGFILARELRPALLAGPPVYAAHPGAVEIVTTGGEWWLSPEELRPALPHLPERYREDLSELCEDASGRAA
jgi:hypothetical protein